MNGLILFEDEQLLVVNKPSGINTHKPDRFTPDGLHEWLTKRQPQWRTLSILHRLDKDTSGVIVFGKTPRANQSLTEQFEAREVKKSYLLLSSTRPTRANFWAKSPNAVTEFVFLEQHGEAFLIEARPLTGKTHQVRRHASENGFPILGDTQYEGEPAPRLMLHAHQIAFTHPVSGQRVSFEASVPRAFDEIDALTAASEFREPLFDELWEHASACEMEPGRARKGAPTNAFRLIAGEVDGFRDVIVDSYAQTLVVQWQTDKAAENRLKLIEQLRDQLSPTAIYEQRATKQRRTAPALVWCSNRIASDEQGSARLTVREHGVAFLIGFGEGLSTGLFLDQRENRRRLLGMRLKGKTVLNTFAYTCAFSVAAAQAGAMTTSVDLSKNYLEWGKDNFRANELDPAAHEYVVGDAFEWLKRFAKRERRWDVVILDPPTFSTTKQGRAFQAARDYEELARLAMPLVVPGGWLLCSTNQRTLGAEEFEKSIKDAARRCSRVIELLEFETLPFDFRLAPKERSYLKTFWARLG